jgi:hypothetical protein
VAVDSTLHEGQHVNRIQHDSRTQNVNSIIVHSNASVEDDFDSSEVSINTLCSIKPISIIK